MGPGPREAGTTRGFRVTSNGFGCGDDHGGFTVHSIEMEQRCGAPAFRARVTLNS
ncbi:hypothetical protein GCM10009634_13230 [Saccharothrix xinjiangensis]